ncbi:MAG: hypothetical protein WAQ28_19770 [Bacteroidia bacterium]
MKKALFYITTIGSSLLCSPVFSQKEAPDSLGLPGDNLNLYAVLDIFQKSETLEGFEKTLNTENSKVNNLDLNNDDKTDYIRVIDNVKGTAHAIVLQVAVNAKENQDVAVIEVEKDNDGNVKIQIVGDELLYGKNYVVEPKQETDKKRMGSTPNPGYSGGTQVTNVTNNYYNDNTTNYNNGAYDYWYPASSWAIVRYMYYPSYVVYTSPWSWGYYPWYWNPWRPMFWHSYYYGCIWPHYDHYYGWYYRSNSIYNNTAHTYYGQRRSTSQTVSARRNDGSYRQTYSRPDLASKEMSKARSESNKTDMNGARAVNNSGSKQERGAGTNPSRDVAGSAKSNRGDSEAVKANSTPARAESSSKVESSSPSGASKHSGSNRASGSGNGSVKQSSGSHRQNSSGSHMSGGSGGSRSFGGGSSGGGRSGGSSGGHSSGGGGGRR